MEFKSLNFHFRKGRLYKLEHILPVAKTTLAWFKKTHFKISRNGWSVRISHFCLTLTKLYIIVLSWKKNLPWPKKFTLKGKRVEVRVNGRTFGNNGMTLKIGKSSMIPFWILLWYFLRLTIDLVIDGQTLCIIIWVELQFYRKWFSEWCHLS